MLPEQRITTSPANSGFTIVEAVVVLTIIAILLTIALIGVSRARDSFQFSNSVSVLQTYLERAISDAKRRNAKGDVRSTVGVVSSSNYDVRIDFDGDGSPETRTISLPPSVTFVFDPAKPPTATVDWRGEIAEGTVKFILRSAAGQMSEITLTGRGDATDGSLPVLPIVSVTPLSTDVRSSTVLVGNSSPAQGISPTPTPTPLPFCSGSQKPATDDCRCTAGKTIDADGKCK